MCQPLNMPPTTSPSDFIYQRPFCVASAADQHNNAVEEIQADKSADRSEHIRHSAYDTPTAIAEWHDALARVDSRKTGPSFHVSHQPSKGIDGATSWSTFGQGSANTPLWPSPEDASKNSIQDQIDQHSGNRQTSSATESTLSHHRFSFCSDTSEQGSQFDDAVGAVHRICLEATKAYLGSHHANRQARASHSGTAGHHCESGKSATTPGRDNDLRSMAGDLNDVPTTSSRPGAIHSHLQAPIPYVSSSLLKNVSGICNMLWVGSQRDRLTVLNVERIAVDNMAKLLSWAEMVALCDYDGWVAGNFDLFHRVLDAGKNLCAWLGVRETLAEMEALERAFEHTYQ